MSKETSTASIQLNAVAYGVPEEVTLDFKASKATITGRFPRKSLGFILLTITIFIGYVWASTSIIDSLFASTAEGTAGYHLQMGSTLVGMLVMYVILKNLLETGEQGQRNDKFARQAVFAKEYLGPWLEANGGITKNPDWVAEDVMNGSVHLKEEENTWKAFNIEFVATGFNRQKQTLHIWRWVKA